MERGWSAKGLLKPLWQRYEGGRDALAAAVGTSGSVLSSINTGKRNLGLSLAGRLADELEVSVLDLGASLGEDDGRGVTLRDRLEELRASLEVSLTEQTRLNRKILTLQARVRKLEDRREPPEDEATGRSQ